MAQSDTRFPTYLRGEEGSESAGTVSLFHFQYSLADDGVATINWNNPKKLNTLSFEVFFEMCAILEHMKRDNGVKVALWTHSGRAFSAGMSAAGFSGAIRHDDEIVAGYNAALGPIGDCTQDMACKRVVLAFLHFPKPNVCAVNGMAVGGGANISLLLMDFCYCSASSSFRYPFSELGISPEISSSYALARIVGVARAKRLLMLGEWFSGEQAADWGLCTESLADAAACTGKAAAVAKLLAAGNPVSLSWSKKLVNEPLLAALDGHVGRALDRENEALSACINSEETKAQMMQFMAKFTGKSKL